MSTAYEFPAPTPLGYFAALVGDDDALPLFADGQRAISVPEAASRPRNRRTTLRPYSMRAT